MMTYYQVTLYGYSDEYNQFFEFTKKKDAQRIYDFLIAEGDPRRHESIELTAKTGDEKRWIAKHIFKAEA